MKKFICATLVLFFGLLLTACGGSSNQTKYEVIEIKDIVITQNGKTKYNIQFDITESITDEKIYFTQNDKLQSTDKPVEVTKTNLTYSFSVDALNEDYILYVVYGDKTVRHGVTFPNMSPTVTTVEAAKKYVKIDYGFNSTSSWSAYCDPAGKNVYRSSKSTFDDTAKHIVKNENIIVGESNDGSPSDEEPFYYVVLKSKNGNVTFISSALSTTENIVEDMSLELKEVDGSAVLNAVVTYKTLITNGDSFLLTVKSGDELYTANGTLVDGNQFEYNFELSQLSKLGVWYDVVLTNGTTGADIAIMDSNANMSSSVTTEDTKYTFKEWAGFLKVNAEAFIPDDVVFTNISLSDVDGVPTLTMVATSSQDFTLEINDSSVQPTKVGNTYTFTYDLSSLTEAGKWYDLNYKIDGVSKTIDATIADFNNKVTVDEKMYEFKEWSNQLKVQFTAAIKMEVEFTSITLTEVGGVPTLTLVATASEDIKVTIRYSDNGEKKDLVTLSPTKNGNTYTFTYDLSNMIVAGDWHDLVYSNNAGDTLDVPEGIVDPSQTVTVGNRTYRFEQWAGQKIAFATND